MEEGASSGAGEARRRSVAEGAIALLARDGARGLTHRRLDALLGLPTGSTSNVFGSREALLGGALRRLVAEDDRVIAETAAQTEATGLDDAARVVAATVERWLAAENRSRLVARYELLLETSRRPLLRRVVLEQRARYTEAAARLLDRVGHPRPRQAADEVVAWVDGVLLAQLVDAEHGLAEEDVVAATARLLGTGAAD